MYVTEESVVSHQRTLYESRNATRRWLHNSRREWISQAVRKWCPRGLRALEIGPGSGIYVPLLKEVCAEVCVADCEEVYLSAIERKHADDPSVRTVVDDITQSRLPPDYFDLVLCTEVVEHISNSRRALHNIARIIRPGGVLVLSTPQRYSLVEMTAKLALSPWLIWITRAIYRESIVELGHINLMTDHEVQAQIAAAYLQVVERHKSGLYLPLIAELLGRRGQQLAARLETEIRGSRFEGILWTQYYVAMRGHATAPDAKS